MADRSAEGSTALQADLRPDPAAAAELRAWAGLSVLSLAVAGFFALLLAVSRIPGIETVMLWPVGFFQKGLVIHVVFSFVVWFLGIFGSLLHLATVALAGGIPKFAALGRFALIAVAVSMPMLFLPAFLDRGEPSLNNYIPAIIDPLYYLGLLVLAGGLLAAILRLLLNLGGTRTPIGGDLIGMLAGAGIFVVALVCFGLSLASLTGLPPSASFNESLFWGGGHVLQFLNTALAAIAWTLLARRALGQPRLGDGPLKAAVLWLLAMVLATPFLYWGEDGLQAARFSLFTDLQYALAPPTVLVAAALLIAILKGRPAGSLPWKDPGFLCLVLSPLVFGVGGVLGLFVDGADTRTPAHYHVVIAGINLAFMGLFYGLLLPILGRGPARSRIVYAQIYLFAFGQTMAAIGLFLAGGYGAPRKTAGAAQGLEGFGQVAGLALNGIGAAIAVIGGILFIWTASKALLGKSA